MMLSVFLRNKHNFLLKKKWKIYPPLKFEQKMHQKYIHVPIYRLNISFLRAKIDFYRKDF